MSFEQAAIEVAKKQEFGELKGALARVFAAEKVEQFLKRLQSKGVRVRDFDLMLASGALEQVDEVLGRPGAGRKLYEALPVSDQAQMREFYLSKVEEVDPAVRTKFQKLYRYY
jgi:hypothetical protein